ncbi:cell elongation-specific peptidoglycan biosynthesis regulator RodA [Comamonas sp. BIGb0124]|uniref:rod shape-determining protein RodA n=1 Tax=Comamonas sp. BIGb0124 TaxID=2485130 RepID=UPI000F467FC8|nr:rod shape-determining protein RodA [Comamonas sp. BIGb0124]ROR22745.1 cell elongation-specific peptidoglycan biosynthesis regulator RodA [Comamonas sp. BIGb0124]
MAVTFNQPPLWRRVLPVFQGYDWWLLLAIGMLVGIGMVTMYSSGFDHGTRFVMHGRNALIAAGVMFLAAQVPPQRWMQLAVPLYTVGVILLLGVEFFGVTKKGATRWLNIGTEIQPSEILKIALPLMLAWWFQRREGQLRPLDYGVAAVILMVPVALIMKQPDLGTSLLVLAAGLGVLFFAGLSWKLIVPPVLIALTGIVAIVLSGPEICKPDVVWPFLHEYQRHRVCTLLDPFSDPLGKGFHIIQGMIAIGSGGIWGKGFLQGTQTHLEFIPERTTDFVFAAYSEEFGLIGNVTLICCYLFLIVRGFIIAMDAPNLFSRLLAGAVTLIFFTYTFVNIGMVIGILPVVGVPLPFISYGGTAMVTLGLGLGILMSISRSRRLMQT